MVNLSVRPSRAWSQLVCSALSYSSSNHWKGVPSLKTFLLLDMDTGQAIPCRADFLKLKTNSVVRTPSMPWFTLRGITGLVKSKQLILSWFETLRLFNMTAFSSECSTSLFISCLKFSKKRVNSSPARLFRSIVWMEETLRVSTVALACIWYCVFRRWTVTQQA